MGVLTRASAHAPAPRAPGGSGPAVARVVAPAGRTLLLTACAMLAFASNSLLCRVALRAGNVDATSFTLLRLASGALVLLPLASRPPRGTDGSHGATFAGSQWSNAIALFAYAGAFSFAYLQLSAAIGTLVLFGTVQLTMGIGGRLQGQRLDARRRWGSLVSLLGLSSLTLPGATMPPLGAVALMAIAGVAWGVYSVRGRGAPSPSRATGTNFMRSVPLGMALWLCAHDAHHATSAGIALSLCSGLASALGYVAWYAALRGLRASDAALVQLSVPVLVAAGGACLLGEPLDARVVLCGVVILGGIALALPAPGPTPPASLARRGVGIGAVSRSRR